MPKFRYRAMTKQGQIVTNVMEDANKESCVVKLKRNGLAPIAIKQVITFTSTRDDVKNKRDLTVSEMMKKMGKTTAVDDEGKIQGRQPKVYKQEWVARLDRALISTEKITSRDIRIFTQNFYLLKKASFNNIHALTTVIETTENRKFKNILEDILAGVESGQYMYTTMEYYSNVFPFIYMNMIKVGELSGSLEQSLEQAVKFLDDSDTLNRKVRKILVPNITMFVGIIVLLFAAVIIGVPMLKGVFESMGSSEQLPAVTLWFADFVDKLILHWYIPVGLITVAAAGFYTYINTPVGRYKFDFFKYKMPIFGKLIYLIDFARLTKNMLLNLQNGIRIQDALDVSKNVVKNTVMLSMIETAINNIYVGQSWIDPFEAAGLGSSMSIEMLKIGMQTDLTEMMEKLGVYMQVDIDNTLEKIVKVLPEVSYLIVGIVLVFFVVVVLVPCIQVYMGGFLFSAYADYI